MDAPPFADVGLDEPEILSVIVMCPAKLFMPKRCLPVTHEVSYRIDARFQAVITGALEDIS